MKRFLFSMFILMFSLIAKAQEPDWIYHLPKAENNTYLYVKESATSYSESDARNVALQKIFQSTAMRIGQPFDSEKVFSDIQQGKGIEVISNTYNIPIYKVCEYSYMMRDGRYKVYILCQIAKSGNIRVDFTHFNNCEKVKRYSNTLSFFQSVFIPGLGQMSKRHYTEGLLTLSSELVLAGAGTYLYFFAQNQLDIMKKENVSYSDFSNSQDKYNTFRKDSYIVWAIFGIVYVFNLYRALTLLPNYKETFAFTPFVMPMDKHLCYGLNFYLNF
ncbi:MAG: hypothetical protein IJ748_03615 [Bacteroidales bacterium]|nr:hypothetical protein [Bacteroidales bacterium]